MFVCAIRTSEYCTLQDLAADARQPLFRQARKRVAPQASQAAAAHLPRGYGVRAPQDNAADYDRDGCWLHSLVCDAKQKSFGNCGR